MDRTHGTPVGRRERRPEHPRADLARSRKARLIAAVLADHHATAATAAALPAEGRATAATLAGVSAPSNATWTAVVALLDSAEHPWPVMAANVAGLVA